MRTDVKCCILWFIDHNKKKYNPGVVLTNDATDQEVTDITCKMQEEGRRVNIFTSHLVDCVTQLPPLDKPFDSPIEGYEYDPFLIW